VKILLNQSFKAVELGDINPNTTVLEWLRGNQFVGTKEGCASGDCGACTAVVGELSSINNKTEIQYKTINTCIALAYSLIGKHLITVEGLSEGNKLHPVQKAMVAENGSQCGFCTPGFVMSLFAMYHNEKTVNLPKINEALSGNLCRCTGYKPIISAAFIAFSEKKQESLDFYERNQAQLIESLTQLSGQKNISLNFKDGNKNILFDAPSDIATLSQVLSKNPTANIVAAGTDLNLEITQSMKEFSHIVSVNRVSELKQIDETDTEIKIGAAVSYEEAKSILVKYWPDLDSFLERFASLPIKNWATIGGNIANASPIGDMPPVLIALESKLNLRKGDSSRTIMLEDFFISYKETLLEPSEFIESILIPKPSNQDRLITHKISKRFEDDISAVCMAMNVKSKESIPHSVKIGFGGMSGIPQRAIELEKVFLNNWDKDALVSAAYEALDNEFTPFSDVRASSEYRLKVSAALVKKSSLMLKGIPVEDLAHYSELQSS
jgi:xanthine dehydrogenase small subunit